jgi:hypothetical protein
MKEVKKDIRNCSYRKNIHKLKIWSELSQFSINPLPCFCVRGDEFQRSITVWNLCTVWVT